MQKPNQPTDEVTRQGCDKKAQTSLSGQPSPRRSLTNRALAGLSRFHVFRRPSARQEGGSNLRHSPESECASENLTAKRVRVLPDGVGRRAGFATLKLRFQKFTSYLRCSLVQSLFSLDIAQDAAIVASTVLNSLIVTAVVLCVS